MYNIQFLDGENSQYIEYIINTMVLWKVENSR